MESINTFKEGDKIRCIGMYRFYGSPCTVGKDYTVEEVNGLWLSLINHPNVFEAKYFEPVKQIRRR